MWFLVRYLAAFLGALAILFGLALLGLVGMGGGLNGRSPTAIGVLVGGGVILVATVPMLWILSLGNAHWFAGKIPRWLRPVGIVIASLAVMVGLYSLVADPGDFLWFGFPMLVFGGAALSLTMEE